MVFWFVFYVVDDGQVFDRDDLEHIMRVLESPKVFKLSYRFHRKQNTGYVFYPKAVSRLEARSSVIDVIHSMSDTCLNLFDLGGQVFENKSKYGGGKGRGGMKITQVATFQNGIFSFDETLVGEPTNLACFECKLTGDDAWDYKPKNLEKTLLKNRIKHGGHAIKQINSIEEKTGVIFDRETGAIVKSKRYIDRLKPGGLKRWLQTKPIDQYFTVKST